MAERNESIYSPSTDRAAAFPKITAFFDGADYILVRSFLLLKHLVQLAVEFIIESKLLILVVVGLIILIIDLKRFITFLLGPHQ